MSAGQRSPSPPPRSKRGGAFVACAALAGLLLCLPGAASAAVTVEELSGTTIVRGDSSDDVIDVACVDDTVKVNGADPASGPVDCFATEEFRIDAGAGADSVTFDAASFPSNGALLAVRAGPGPDGVRSSPGGRLVLAGGPGRDSLTGSAGPEDILGGRGPDVIRGFAGNDYLTGGRGADVLRGGRDDDIAFGGRGFDRIRGGAHRDVLEGGSGPDRLNGGAGKDRCRKSSRDRLRRCEMRSNGPILNR